MGFGTAAGGEVQVAGAGQLPVVLDQRPTSQVAAHERYVAERVPFFGVPLTGRPFLLRDLINVQSGNRPGRLPAPVHREQNLDVVGLEAVLARVPRLEIPV